MPTKLKSLCSNWKQAKYILCAVHKELFDIYGSKTWTTKMEHELKLNRTNMSMIRWMCGFISKKEEKCRIERTVGLQPVSLVTKKGRLRQLVHVESKHDTDWIKHCTLMEVEGQGHLRKTRWDDIKEAMKRFGLCRKYAQSWRKWRRKINGGFWLSWLHLEDGH